MALIKKNDASTMALRDQGLKVNTEMYLQECIAITNKQWKEAKQSLDDMKLAELEKFIAAVDVLNLPKAGTVTFRVSVQEYALLKAHALRLDVNQTKWLECMLKKENT
ncbi:hypothetical protein IC627_23185 (plasmid) [Photobacterium damselae subsp. piscicida]|uniref:Uncharacterized protein n=1 Tax=Photobacterium damsela subsp. piscicida TaxID=38294 RepID=A0A1V1VHZ2_PHODP|nr:hypothetical protein [Photobacterium damselae]MBE8127850.1 hypothetical protein [Photobacterium damselae subsp. piscicida]MDP2544691.1 hypothetical protein [Photobacterium damselae subsp. piscicida]PSW75956.1 hypothetical protein CTT37_16690 [Photobacterium damselae]QOD55296.1 hypothetical protein IC628_23075 [Photobacterium damselae subsp. piscicida]QOD59121.1 hypothetical protein IC627_23185 [Photobacterium damselae subsp. piscicida]